jgi:hypothetical protein
MCTDGAGPFKGAPATQLTAGTTMMVAGLCPFSREVAPQQSPKQRPPSREPDHGRIVHQRLDQRRG